MTKDDIQEVTLAAHISYDGGDIHISGSCTGVGSNRSIHAESICPHQWLAVSRLGLPSFRSEDLSPVTRYTDDAFIFLEWCKVTMTTSVPRDWPTMLFVYTIFANTIEGFNWQLKVTVHVLSALERLTSFLYLNWMYLDAMQFLCHEFMSFGMSAGAYLLNKLWAVLYSRALNFQLT